jgi:hypothetical protein
VAISANERDQAAAMLRAVLAERGLSPGESIAIMLCAIERIVRGHVAPNAPDFTIGACAGALQLLGRTPATAALDYGCTEITAQSRVSAVMRRLRNRLERQEASRVCLRASARADAERRAHRYQLASEGQ